MNSSHQDIAWVNRPEVCIILRDTLLLTPVLEDAFVREDYGFDIENGLILREYLERHPESRAGSNGAVGAAVDLDWGNLQLPVRGYVRCRRSGAAAVPR